MSKACKTLGTVILILGGLVTLGMAVNYAKPYEYADFDFWMFLTVICIGGIVVSLFSFAMLALGKMLEYMQRMDYNIYSIATMISHMQSQKNQPTYKDGWTCKKCGRNNPGHTGTCVCGGSKDA